MPSVIISHPSAKGKQCPHLMDSVGFGRASVQFAALGLIAEQNKCTSTSLHLYALSIELGFKSLALRLGATPSHLKVACGHKISKLIETVERLGAEVPAHLKKRLNDDAWFNKMLATRYPIFALSRSFKDTLFFHKNYPEMIAAILEIPCPFPFRFEGGSALTEIKEIMSGEKVRPGGAETMDF